MRHIGLAFAVVLAASPAFAANLVHDGGFERPPVGKAPSCGVALCAGFNVGQSLFPWVVIGPGAAPGAFAILLLDTQYAEGDLRFEAAGGEQSIDLTGSYNQGLNGVRQTILTAAGQAYTVSFAVGHADRGAYLPDSKVQLVIDGNPLATADNGDVTANMINWKTFSYTFTAASDTTTIDLYNATTNSNYVGLDQVSVKPAKPTK